MSEYLTLSFHGWERVNRWMKPDFMAVSAQKISARCYAGARVAMENGNRKEAIFQQWAGAFQSAQARGHLNKLADSKNPATRKRAALAKTFAKVRK